MAIVPSLTKAAAVVGGSFGEGVMITKDSGGSWGRTPAFIDAGGASAGLQLGVTETDLVLVFMTKESVEPFLDGELKFGADATAVAGPKEFSASAGQGDSIYTYSHKDGVFAGVSVEGLAINIDESANRDAYGRQMTARELFTGGAQQVQAKVNIQPLLDALASQAPARAE